ncbi:hypothetical protein WH390_06755 [Candidatus Arsenophonus nilaparvatae]|uniref:hypothetical protein n=1 Tax=Candidatus Arsenophonus nilaparvatae TaxID=1247023 RepID=UPI0005098C6B|nr:hypothetical protein [Candidatus Arsenophonus nilaparvatae]
MTFYKNNIAQVQLIKFAALNSDVDVMAIKPYDVFKSILGIKNSHQNIANNVKSDNCKLTSEKDAALTKPEFSAFITEHLQNVFIAAKNANNPLEKNNLANLTAANNQLHYAGNDIVKFTNQNDGVKVEPTYAAPYDSVEKQQYASNDVYYDAEGYSIVGQEKHIYEQISDYALEEGEQMENEIYYNPFGENEEHIYETISDNTSDKITSYLNSNKETNLTNNLTSLEKSVATTVARNEITRLAEQTFAPPKSFISRLASSIWNAISGSKNQSKIVPPAELVACAMRVNIDGICDRLNECLAKKTISGAFRQQPGSEYSLTDNEKLVHTFNKDSRQHDHIESSFLIKAYIGSNFPKIGLEELNNTGFSTNKFNQLLDKKLTDCMLKDPAKQHLPTVLTTIANTLRLATGENKIDGLTKESIVTSMLPSFVDIMYIATHKEEANQIKDLIANYLIENY